MKTLTNFDYKMFEKAHQVSYTSTYKTHSLGCVIAYKHHIISEASNSNKTHPKQRKYNRRYRTFKKSEKPIVDSVHAEMKALNEIPYPIAQQIDWSKVKVYIYRSCPGKERGFGMARPCEACIAALRDKGIRHIYYTTDAGYCYEHIF